MTIYTPQTASADSAKLLAEVDSQVGFIPNVFAILAESTPALSAFVGLSGAFAESTLSAIEQEVVEIATSAVNSCGYCVAGHTVFAQKLAMDAATIDALRAEVSLSDPRLDALAYFARALARRNGHDCEAEIADFFGVGFSRAQALEVIIGVSVKTISNLASNAFGIPIDDAFSGCEWHSGSNHQGSQKNVA